MVPVTAANRRDVRKTRITRRRSAVASLIVAETGHTALNQPPAFSSLPLSASATAGPERSCRVCDLLRHGNLVTRFALFGEDEKDSAGLADLLRMGRLPEAWIAPAESVSCGS